LLVWLFADFCNFCEPVTGTLPCGKFNGESGVASLPRFHVGKVISRSVPAKSVAATEVEMISKCAENYLSPGLKNYGMARKKAKESLSDGRVNGRKRARKPSTSSSNSTHNNIDSLWIRC